MSSQKRIDSARANGAKSRGPATPEGRARSRAARLTHGLTSDLIVLEYESQKDFDAMREEYFAEYQPQTRSRFDLVDQLVITRWRLNRVLVLQSVLMENQMIRQQPEIPRRIRSLRPRDPGRHRLPASDRRCGALESLNRHETRLSAELRRTLKLLDSPPKNQKLHHEPSPAQPPRSDEDTDAAETQPSATDHPPSTTKKAPSIPEQRATSDPQRASKLAEAASGVRSGRAEPALQRLGPAAD